MLNPHVIEISFFTITSLLYRIFKRFFLFSSHLAIKHRKYLIHWMRESLHPKWCSINGFTVFQVSYATLCNEHTNRLRNQKSVRIKSRNQKILSSFLFFSSEMIYFITWVSIMWIKQDLSLSSSLSIYLSVCYYPREWALDWKSLAGQCLVPLL